MSKQKLCSCVSTLTSRPPTLYHPERLKIVNPDQVLVGLTWELLGLEPPVLIRDLSALTTDFGSGHGLGFRTWLGTSWLWLAKQDRDKGSESWWCGPPGPGILQWVIPLILCPWTLCTKEPGLWSCGPPDVTRSSPQLLWCGFSTSHRWWLPSSQTWIRLISWTCSRPRSGPWIQKWNRNPSDSNQMSLLYFYSFLCQE